MTKLKTPYKIKIAKSQIQGNGVFAIKDIPHGEIIDDEIVRGTGYNFSCVPNVIIARSEDGRSLASIALRKIGYGEELTVVCRWPRGDELVVDKPFPECNCPTSRK